MNSRPHSNRDNVNSNRVGEVAGSSSKSPVQNKFESTSKSPSASKLTRNNLYPVLGKNSISNRSTL